MISIIPPFNRAFARLCFFVFIVSCAHTVFAQPIVATDLSGDAVIRRTDHDGDGLIDPQTQRLPDLIQTRIGSFSPSAPELDRFAGTWDPSGLFFRFDMVFVGLINPPGRLGLDNSSPIYDPFRFGPNPIYGYIEFDLDADENTGGELKSPDFRYLGNVARFGGLPNEPQFAGRAALDDSAFDNDVTSPPLTDRSGEEFHIAFLGENIQSVQVQLEKPGGDPQVFEDGEVWRIDGELFHRAHGFEDFSITCFARQGRYEPKVIIQFSHDTLTNTTTVSLVYPFDNTGSAALVSPTEPVQPNNGCARNQQGNNEQNSIEEALIDLQFSAANADPFDQTLPEFQLIAGWAFKTISDHLNPSAWRISGLVGTGYGTIQSDGSLFIWTDVFPNPRVGDFNGDALLDDTDVTLLNNFITSADGDSSYDVDGNGSNGSIDLKHFANNFSVYDTNYDGFIDAFDPVVIGDMDLDQVLDINDVDDFIQGILDPSVYSATHNGIDPLIRGDINGDNCLNGRDIPELVNRLLNVVP